jgi:hypothetical protein
MQQDGLYSIYNMSICLGKDMQNEKQTVTTIQAIVKSFTSRAEGVGHIPYMDNFFSTPHLFDNLHMRAVNYCGIVGRILKGCWGDLTAVIWKDKQYMYKHINQQHNATPAVNNGELKKIYC